jgi:hypothetical protein
MIRDVGLSSDPPSSRTSPRSDLPCLHGGDVLAAGTVTALAADAKVRPGNIGPSLVISRVVVWQDKQSSTCFTSIDCPSGSARR